MEDTEEPKQHEDNVEDPVPKDSRDHRKVEHKAEHTRHTMVNEEKPHHKEHTKAHEVKPQVTHSGHSSSHSRQLKSVSVSKYLPYLLLLLVVIVLINLIFLNQATNAVVEQQSMAAEIARLPELSVVSITDESCSDCYSMAEMLTTLTSGAYNVTEVTTLDINDARSLIDEYSIDKIPALLVRGEVEKVTFNGFSTNGDARIATASAPPYVQTSDGSIQGIVTPVILTAECDVCADLDVFLNQLEGLGVVFDEPRRVLWTNAEEVTKYDIKVVPTLVFSEDLSVYDEVMARWSEVGTVESDGSYVVRPVDPPFINVSSGVIEGFVDATYVVDGSCDECFDVDVLNFILSRVGIVFDNNITVDINKPAGKAVVEKYNLKAVPTIIMSSEASSYPTIVKTWSQVGSVEGGEYVLRQPAIGGTYKNLTSGEVVVPQRQ